MQTETIAELTAAHDAARAAYRTAKAAATAAYEAHERLSHPRLGETPAQRMARKAAHAAQGEAWDAAMAVEDEAAEALQQTRIALEAAQAAR